MVGMRHPRRRAPFRITPRVHEVRAARKRSRFRGRSNLVEPDEVSGGPQATDRLAIDRNIIIFEFNYCSLKQASLLVFSKTVRANAGETRGAPIGRDERESACYLLARRQTSERDLLVILNYLS